MKPTTRSLQVDIDDNEGTYDSVTPPCPSTGNMIRLRKSVLFCRICCTMPFRSSSSCLHLAVALSQLRACPCIEVVTLHQIRPVARFVPPQSLVASKCQPSAYQYLLATAQAPPCMKTSFCQLMFVSNSSAFLASFFHPSSCPQLDCKSSPPSFGKTICPESPFLFDHGLPTCTDHL